MPSLLQQLLEMYRYKTYHISYDASNDDSRRRITGVLEKKGAIRILESSWLLKTTDSANEVLSDMLKVTEVRIFISEVPSNWSTNLT